MAVYKAWTTCKFRFNPSERFLSFQSQRFCFAFVFYDFAFVPEILFIVPYVLRFRVLLEIFRLNTLQKMYGCFHRPDFV